MRMSYTDWEIQTRAVEISRSALWLPVAIGNIASDRIQFRISLSLQIDDVV